MFFFLRFLSIFNYSRRLYSAPLIDSTRFCTYETFFVKFQNHRVVHPSRGTVRTLLRRKTISPVKHFDVLSHFEFPDDHFNFLPSFIAPAPILSELKSFFK